MISNGLVAFSEAIFAQNIKVADLQSGVGTLVIGLAAIILGLGVIKKSQLINETSIIILGSLAYYFIINLALMSNTWTKNLYRTLNFSDDMIKTLEIRPTDAKIITAVILVIILWNEMAKKIKKGKKKAKMIKEAEGN